MVAGTPEARARNAREDGCAASSIAADRGYFGTEAKREGLMELVVSRENMMAAHRRVVANKGAAGVDDMPVEALLAYLREHWAGIKEDLLKGRYQPSPLLKVEIPKPGGGVRQLGIPTVLDRLIRALSFIEGSKGDQMKRVEGAIRSLLGLGVVEEALGHTRKVGTELNQKVKKGAGNRRELQAVSDRLAGLQEELPDLEEQVKRAKEARLKLEDLEEEADRKLSDALRKGNREELEEQRKSAIHGRQSAEKDAA